MPSDDVPHVPFLLLTAIHPADWYDTSDFQQSHIDEFNKHVISQIAMHMYTSEQQCSCTHVMVCHQGHVLKCFFLIGVFID